MNIFDKIFRKKQNNELFLPDFDKYNDFAQIVSIFDYVLNPDYDIANRAAVVIHKLFETTCVIKNKHVFDTIKYLKINKEDIKRFDRFDFDIKITLVCIASLNGNGYVREIALEKLKEFKSQKVITFILLRLADWVPIIRKKAKEIIKCFVVEENVHFFIENHKLINWLLNVEKTDLSNIFNEIVDLITSKQLDPKDIEQLTEGERFFYFNTLAKQGKLNNELIFQMLNDNYYLIRFIVIRNLEKLQISENVIEKLLTDKSQKIREKALSQIHSHNIKQYEELLNVLIFDISSTIRFESRKLLNNLNKHDFKILYKNKLNENKELIGAILGLSETSDKSDIETIRHFLKSNRAKIKSAALLGIYNLDKELATEIAYQIIDEQNPVSTKKMGGLILSKVGVDYNIIRQIYDSTDLTGKKIILKLLNKFSGWSVAGDFLKALTENDENLSLMANSFLKQWDSYTVRLATKQRPEEKEYVLNWYSKAKERGLKVPENIPFIFGNKQV